MPSSGPPASTHSAPCFTSRPARGGSPYRVAWRTPSWFENTQVVEDPVTSDCARLSVTISRKCAASKSASIRSKLNACPRPSGLAYFARRSAVSTHASATAIRGGS